MHAQRTNTRVALKPFIAYLYLETSQQINATKAMPPFKAKSNKLQRNNHAHSIKNPVLRGPLIKFDLFCTKCQRTQLFRSIAHPIPPSTSINANDPPITMYNIF